MVELSEREVGRWEQTLSDVRHRARNDRQVLLLMQEDLESLRREVDRMKTRLYTALSIALILGPVAAWLFDSFLR
jgi:hypothetical protein